MWDLLELRSDGEEIFIVSERGSHQDRWRRLSVRSDDAG
jgi:hypothetical protein